MKVHILINYQEIYRTQLIQLFQILYAKDVDQRSTTFEKSMSVGKDYQRRTRMLILRAAMLKQQIHVKVN